MKSKTKEMKSDPTVVSEITALKSITAGLNGKSNKKKIRKKVVGAKDK